MSKATFIQLVPKMDSEAILGYFRGQGFLFPSGKDCVVEFGGQRYLDITQRMDDTGNGLGDGRLYLDRKAGIGKQAGRKRKDGWSETKVRNWVDQKERVETVPIEVGAAQWIVRLQGLFVQCRISRVVLVVAINNMQLVDRVFAEGPELELSGLDPMKLILLEHNVRYGIRP